MEIGDVEMGEKQECAVIFAPQNVAVRVKKGANLLEAVSDAHITINNLCGGDGICGRCKMIVKSGEISGEVSAKLSRDEIRNGYVLGCQVSPLLMGFLTSWVGSGHFLPILCLWLFLRLCCRLCLKETYKN